MRKFLSALTFAFLLLACAKEAPRTFPEDFTLEAAMPSAFTKTTLGSPVSGSYPVLWSEGDRISVNGVLSRPLTASQAGGRTALFRFSEPIKMPYRVRYGGDVPSVQQYREGNIGDGCAPMSTLSYATSFTLNHESCVLALPLSGEEKVVGITLSSLDATPLSGSGSVQMTMPSGGVDVSSEKHFCLAVSAGTQSKGIRTEIVTASGARMIFTAFIGERLSAGTVYEFPSTVFASNAEPLTVIADYAQLKAFAARVAGGEKYLEARLASDMAVDDSWTPLEGFTGDFDGGGYTLSGLKKAFANELKGSVRNLSVEGQISISSQNDIVGDETVNWAGIIANRIYAGGSVENCVSQGSITYHQWGGRNIIVGGLCGYAPRGVVRHSINRASVVAVGNGSSAIYAGGLFGRIYASSDVIRVENCRNEGSVTVRGTVKGASVGGIVGQMDAAHTCVLMDDENSGEITLDASASVTAEINLGGVAGLCKNELSACSNSGLIHQGAATASAQNVGGIAGQVVTGLVQNCRNGGKVLLNGASAAVVRCGGILGYAFNDTSVSSITVDSCSFSGELYVDIPVHSTLLAKAITGLYNILTHTETACSSSGTVIVK